MKYRVRSGGGVIGPDRKLYKAGDILPQGLLTKKQAEAHISAGYLQVIGSADQGPKQVLPGVKGDVSLPGEVDLGNPTPKKRSTRKKKTAPIEVKSLWDLNPEGLRSMSLEALNVAICEKDDTLPEFETKDEAIAWLSQDYKEPQK